MEERKRRRKTEDKGIIVSLCPDCKGKGKIPKMPSYMANPVVPATRPERMGFKVCPRCEGSGKIGEA